MPGRIASHASRSGLELNDEALQALEGLPEEHALELLDATSQKFQSGQLKSPSNYVCATIARGYVPRAGKDSGGKGADKGAGGGGGGGKGIGPALSSAEYEVAAAALINTPGMQRAEAVGLQLTDEAVHALLRLPSSHASEILDAVADKHSSLRDPSNYVVATIARGYSPRNKGNEKGSEKGCGSGGGGGSRDLYETIYGGSQDTGGGYGSKGDSRKGDSSKGKYGGKSDYGKDYGRDDYSRDQGKGGGKRHGMLPDDVTRLESAVLELNDMDLWMGQEIGASTMITLRCVGEENAMDMLENLRSKGMSKGGKGITSINNYIQAAVAKVVREGGDSANGKGGRDKNYTGNQSRTRASELGLTLHEETYSFLARMPLRSAMALMEKAAEAQARGEDPNAFIEKDGPAYTDTDDREGGTKRPRLEY